MFKFIKKTVLVVGVLALAGFLVFGAGLSSYMRTGYKRVKSRINSSIPVEFEIHRIEDLIEQISPELAQVQDLVAEEQVSMAALREEIAGRERSAARQGEEVRIIRASLDSPAPRIRLGGRTWERSLVESDLGHRLDSLKSLKALVDSKKRLLEARERALQAAKQKLVSIASERTRLETMVQQLRAELREQQALASSCLSVKIDDSRLKEAQELVRRVKHRLAVNRKKLENSGIRVQCSGVDLRPVFEKPRDVRAEVDAFLAAKDAPLLEAAPEKLTRH